MRNAGVDDRGAVAGNDDGRADHDDAGVDRVPTHRRPLARIDALDGVRTIAVYLVVAFHAGLTSFEGGFIGVDVFFVLSGFLITRLLLDEHERRGRVDLARFYARRARRLLPAAWVAIVTTALLYVGVATPFEREAVVGDARAALLYVANWNFVREGQDYFAESLESSPFLHLWSLSVEEQFYLIWPLAALAVFRVWTRSPRAALLLVGATTLAGAAWALSVAADDIVRAYYGTDTRAYQLLAGAALALAFAVRRPARLEVHEHLDPSRRAGAMAIATASALIGLVVLSTSFGLDPVERGLGATVITLVLIAALVATAERQRSATADGDHVRVARWMPQALLASRPMTSLGHLSYATYLWHWPIVIVFGRVFDAGPRLTFAVVVLSSTAIAKLSMDLVERPVRRRGARADRRRNVATSMTALLITVVLAVAVVPAILRSDVGMLRAADRPGFASGDAGSAPPTAPVATAPSTETLSGGIDDASPAPSAGSIVDDGADVADTVSTDGADDVPADGLETDDDAPTPVDGDGDASLDGVIAPDGSGPPPDEQVDDSIIAVPFGPEPTGPLPVPDDLGQGSIDTDFVEKSGCVNEIPTYVYACTTVTGSGPRVLLIGDSHASKLNVAFNEYGARNDLTVATVSGNGCPWQDGLLFRDALPVEAAKQFCRDQRDALYDWFADEFAPDVVVIANHDQTTENYDVVPRPERGTDESLSGLDLIARTAAASFDRLASAGSRVVLLEPLPNSPFHPINCLSAATAIDDCAFGVGAWPHLETPLLRGLADERATVETVDMTPLTCPHFPLCRPIIDGVAVRDDPDHLDVRHTLRIIDPLMSRIGL